MVIINMAQEKLDINDFLYQIAIFDDGNLRFREYPNKWMVTSIKFNGQKYTLRNFIFHNIKINSISSWKLQKYQEPE